MRPVVIAAALIASLGAPVAAAQTWGQPYGRAPSVTWGQPHGTWGAGLTEWDGRAYAATGRAATGFVNGPAPAYGGATYSYGGHAGYGDPRAYRPPGGHGYSRGYDHGHGYGYGHDRGGRYGYSAGDRWTRWSSPPGRGYHDVYGYNDDRPPRGPDPARRYSHACRCDVGPYPYAR